MKQNKFDLVMDYIDANISQDVESIKKGIYEHKTANVYLHNTFFSLKSKTASPTTSGERETEYVIDMIILLQRYLR